MRSSPAQPPRCRVDVRLAAACAVAVAVVVSSACASAPRASATLRVLVFNIHAGKDAAGQPNLEQVAALVKSTRADLVLLQEVDRGTRRSGKVDQLKVLADLTGYDAAFGRSLDYDGGVYGIAALSSQRIASHATESLPIEPPQARAGGSYEPRAALTLAAATRVGPLSAVNTHLDASRDEHYRLQESRHIVAMMKMLTAGGARAVAGGDYNAEPGSETYKQLIAGGLRDAWRECGTGNGLTYPASRPVKRIDYLFLTADLRCASAEVIETTISDHRPLLVTIGR